MRPVARVSDLHLCPSLAGVPAPILPPGMPTVRVGGLPVARLGDLCACSITPDPIMRGSLTVRVGNQPVARMGDATLKSGIITTGCATVRVGG